MHLKREEYLQIETQKCKEETTDVSYCANTHFTGPLFISLTVEIVNGFFGKLLVWANLWWYRGGAAGGGAISADNSGDMTGVYSYTHSRLPFMLSSWSSFCKQTKNLQCSSFLPCYFRSSNNSHVMSMSRPGSFYFTQFAYNRSPRYPS